MKILGFDSVCIWSDHYRELANFYEKTLGFEKDKDLNYPDEQGVQFIVGPSSYLFIGFHSGVNDKSKDKYRIMPGFLVESVAKIYDKLLKKGVRIIAKPRCIPDKTAHVLTIADPEDNIIQFFSISS